MLGRLLQRTLTDLLADKGGREVISFRYCNCIVFGKGETIKLFLPLSVSAIDESPKDRFVLGDLLLIFENDVQRVGPSSKKYKFNNFITTVPLVNFPSIIASSLIRRNGIEEDFFRRIQNLLNTLPDSKSDWTATFGEDFLTRTAVDRCVATVQHLANNH